MMNFDGEHLISSLSSSPKRRRKSKRSATGSRTMRLVSLASVLLISASCGAVQAQNLTDAQVALISETLEHSALLSWELGTRAQTILSLNATGFSVYSSTDLPPPNSTDAFGHANASALAPFFDIARTVVQNRTNSNGNITGPQPLMQDAAAADPASIGFAVLLANWTGQDNGTIDYAGAAKDQLDFLLQKVPRTPDGAISHRVAEVQLWSDFVYMVPPFLAYYGVLASNITLVAEAYNQIRLYRSYLHDPNAGGLWKHVLLGSSGNDTGHWSTGNGWAAAGMLRVLGTIKHSKYANYFKREQRDLANWALEIQNAMYAHLDSTYIFANWADQPVDASNFYDASSTALLASTVYRLSLLASYHRNLPIAERCRQTLFARNASFSGPSNSSTNSSSDPSSSSSSISTSLQNMNHFTSDGYLTPVVNPHWYSAAGNVSAEAQAFVLELHAAWRDWVLDGAQGANGASPATTGRSLRSATLASVGVGTWLML